ncbi:SDR family oxidoreductase [Gemmatimonas sp.]|uniref:SDR family NAD(P)-dependent oxidoreductase n=1 Tax=Gemmatimonas sp. TaxID=1962908 RepID=UPI0033414AFF
MRIDSETVAVVTGAARGIGRAVAEALHARGARVAALDVDAAELMSHAATPNWLALPCDVSSEGATARAAEDVAKSYGLPNLLIACAGVSVAGAVEASTRAQMERAMAVNFWGVVHTCREFLPALRTRAGTGQPAAIVVVLSDFAFFSLPTKAAYAASKHAAHAFTLALAGELAGSGVRVIAVYPGATATDFVARGEAVDPQRQAREAAYLARGMRPEAVAARIIRGVERGQTRVLVGIDTQLLHVVTRLAPTLTQWAVRRWWRRLPFL